MTNIEYRLSGLLIGNEDCPQFNPGITDSTGRIPCTYIEHGCSRHTQVRSKLHLAQDNKDVKCYAFPSKTNVFMTGNQFKQDHVSD